MTYIYCRHKLFDPLPGRQLWTIPKLAVNKIEYKHFLIQNYQTEVTRI